MTVRNRGECAPKAQQVYISRDIPSQELQGEFKLITTDEIYSAAAYAAEDTPKSKVTIITDPQNAFSDSFIADGLSIKLLLDCHVYNFKTMSFLDKCLMRMQHTSSKDEFRKSVGFAVRALTSKIPSVMRLDDALGLIASAAPEFSVDDMTASEYAMRALERSVNERNREIINSISVDPENPNIEVLEMEYGSELVEHIIRNPGNYAFTGGLGAGKTSKGMMVLFERLCEMGQYPILCGATQILMASLVSGDRHYKTARHLLNERTSKNIPVAGVVNSVLGTDWFEEVIEQGTALLIEEPEDTFSHVVGSAVGQSGSLNERAELNDALDNVMESRKWNILADAMLINETVDRIAAVTGKKVIICRPKNTEKHKITVKYYKAEAECVAVTNNAIEAGQNVVTFCDGSHNSNRSRFNELHKSIAKDGVKSLVIDGDSMKREGAVEFIRGIDSELEKYQHAMISPVVNSGVDIRTDHYRKVAFLGYQTIAPNQLIQSLRRFRKVTEIDLSINPSNKKNPASSEIVLVNELFKELKDFQMTDDTLREYKQSASVAKVIDRIVFENRMRQDYINTVLVMLEHLGFNIVYVEHDKDLKKQGAEEISTGSLNEHIARCEAIKSVPALTDKAAMEIRKNQEFATLDSKYKLAAHDICKFFKVSKIDDQLIEFDSHGSGRTVIRNMQYAREPIPIKIRALDCLKRTTIKTMFDMLNIDHQTFKGVFNAAQARDFLDWINSGSIKIGWKIFSARIAIETTFPEVKITKQPGKVIGEIMNTGFRLNRGELSRKRDEGKQDRRYTLVETDHSKMAEKYYAQISGDQTT